MLLIKQNLDASFFGLKPGPVSQKLCKTPSTYMQEKSEL